MATFRDVWNHIRGVQTTTGTYTSLYHPGAPHEYVIVVRPDGTAQHVPTPALLDWFLAAEDGKIVIHYTRNDGGGKTPVRVPTAIACGQPVGQLVTGGVGPVGVAGPQGPRGENGAVGPPGAPGQAGADAVALTDQDVDRIAARVWLAPPPDGYQNISGADFATLAQEVVAYMLTQRQDVWAAAIQRIDEAAIGLLQGGYQPKVNQGG